MMKNQVTKAKAIGALEKSLQRFSEVERLLPSSADYVEWRLDTEKAIEKIFGEKMASRFSSIASTASLLAGQGKVQGMLRSLINQVSEWHDDERDRSRSFARLDPRKVFIVHGHDEAAKNIVKAFLNELNLTPVVLADEVSEGHTIIEKIEKHGQVDFAVVLLTPDDVGSHRDDTKMAKRARQNVIFEFGFFLGKIGRKNVRALVKGDVEILSDYSGVVYIDFDDGEWKLKLAKEMKAAGLVFDMNRLLESR